MACTDAKHMSLNSLELAARCGDEEAQEEITRRATQFAVETDKLAKETGLTRQQVINELAIKQISVGA